MTSGLIESALGLETNTEEEQTIEETRINNFINDPFVSKFPCSVLLIIK